jgi:hypothetical protein
MSLVLTACGRCSVAQHARDAEQRSALSTPLADRSTEVCHRERWSPANQADGADRTRTFRVLPGLGGSAAHPQR